MEGVVTHCRLKTALKCRTLAARRNNSGVFHHQNHSSLLRSRPVKDSFRHDETLSRTELDGAAFEIDQQQAFDNIEELVIRVMLVPMIFTFDDAKPNDGSIHLAECLVEPLVGAGVGKRLLL